MTTFTWPAWYPDNCPPADAVAASGVVYRVVRQTEVAAEDFVALLAHAPERVQPGDECKASGLSVYRELADIDYLRRTVRAFRNRHIAAGTIDGIGLLKPTPRKGDSHLTWWVPVDGEPQQRFAVAEEGGDS